MTIIVIIAVKAILCEDIHHLHTAPITIATTIMIKI